MSPSPSVTLRAVTLEWPDGTVALDRVDGTFTAGRTGLVGRNGAGKSTLLRLVAGLLAPTSGSVEVTGDVGYLPQTLTLARDTTVAELLGIDRTLAALRAIESGDVHQRHFDAVGDDWDIEARADESLHQIGFSAADLTRRVAQVSGGEAVLIAVTGLRLRRTAVTLLDEPTNNLDRPTRARLAEIVDHWPGTLVVVSHDLELLEHVDRIAELHDGVLERSAGRTARGRSTATPSRPPRSRPRGPRSRRSGRRSGSAPRRRRRSRGGRAPHARPSGTAGSRRSWRATGPAGRRPPQAPCGRRSTTGSGPRRPRSTPPTPGSGTTRTSASCCRTPTSRAGAGSPS